jgi:glycosyltransferase involved in cell wall biosynthesis
MNRRILKAAYDWTLGSRLLGDSSRIIVSTKSEEEDVVGTGINENKVYVLTNFLDLGEFESLPPRGEFRERLRLEEDKKVVLYLGRIHRIKGLDLLLRAFSQLSRESYDAHLVLAGPDERYVGQLMKLARKLKINDRLSVCGPQYGRDKLSVYVDSDVYVLPSRYESFGSTALEACLCGTPTIVTSNCGIAEMLNDIGYVVERNQAALSLALDSVLRKSISRTEIKRLSRLVVEERLDIKKATSELERVYHECI